MTASAGAVLEDARKVDVRLPGKDNFNCHGARPVHLIITMMKWVGTGRLSIQNSFFMHVEMCSKTRQAKRDASCEGCEIALGPQERTVSGRASGEEPSHLGLLSWYG